jgi:hypothetical protein
MPQSLIAFCEALSQTPFSMLIQDIGWIIPLVQTFHILSIAVVIGSVGMIDLRLLGLAGRSQSISSMTNRLLPAVWAALAVLLCTGAVLAIGEPVRSLANPAFQLKMLLLLLVIALTVFFQRSLRKDLAFWELSPTRRLTARLTAVVSLLLWVGIVFAGRWIAYMDTGY